MDHNIYIYINTYIILYIYIYDAFRTPLSNKIVVFIYLARMLIQMLILTVAPEVARSKLDVSAKLMQLMIEKPAVPDFPDVY